MIGYYHGILVLDGLHVCLETFRYILSSKYVFRNHDGMPSSPSFSNKWVMFEPLA